MRQVHLTGLKRYLRWIILGLALFFLAATLKNHWQEVVSIRVTAATWAGLAVALGVTLLAHIWSGWVWHWILAELGLSIKGLWTISVYLKTNLAKYLPGNVWHFFGRVRALQAAGASTETAIVGVLLEPLLMAAGALSLAALASWQLWILPLLVLGLVLGSVHPRFLNPILHTLAQVQARVQGLPKVTETTRLIRYPLKPYLGELGFVLLRGMGFVLTIAAIQPLSGWQILPVLGGFSLAWLTGLVVPGVPGGIGVFEAVAIALLSSQLAPGLLLSSVAFYRLISTLAEAIGAGLIWLDDPYRGRTLPPARPLFLPPGPSLTDGIATEETLPLETMNAPGTSDSSEEAAQINETSNVWESQD